MKKWFAVFLAVIALFCGCEKKVIPPELTMASHIYHSSGTEFYPEDYCKIKSHSGGNVAVTYEGEFDANVEGDYKITVTADDEFGGDVSKEITVTVRENRSGIDNKTVCKNLNEYINGLVDGGMSNISHRDSAEGFGKMASAYSSDGGFEVDGASGKLQFETLHMENERHSALNAVFSVDEKAMWYIPQKVCFTAGDINVEVAVSDGLTENGKYGCYVILNEYGEDSGEKHPDYAALEKLRGIAEYDGEVVMEAIGTSGSYKFVLSDGHKKDFADILGIYEEMLAYYR